MTVREDHFPVVTYTDDQTSRQLPDGQCRCCGTGPTPDGELLIRQAGLCDSDGVFYAMLCDYCLDEILTENKEREQTFRDDLADVAADLFGDDLDGLQAEMDDAADFPLEPEE